MQHKLVHRTIIAVFVTLYALVATISMINSVAFFDLAHDGLMSWVLAIGFELGAAASLGAIIILDRTNKAMVWGLFILLTLFQMMANSFHAYVNLQDYMGWIELFGLERMSPIEQKRNLSISSGAVLPVIALGFIKSLVDYIRPEAVTIEQGETLVTDIDPTPNELHERPDVQEALRRVATMSTDAEADEEPTALANSGYRLEEIEDPETNEPEVEGPIVEPKGLEEPIKQAAPAAQVPASPAKPSQPVAKKMIPANSGGASLHLRPGTRLAPVAGSPK